MLTGVQLEPSQFCVKYVSAMAKQELFQIMKYPDTLPDFDSSPMVREWVANKLQDTPLFFDAGNDRKRLLEVVDAHWELLKSSITRAAKQKRKQVVFSMRKVFHGTLNNGC